MELPGLRADRPRQAERWKGACARGALRVLLADPVCGATPRADGLSRCARSAGPGTLRCAWLVGCVGIFGHTLQLGSPCPAPCASGYDGVGAGLCVPCPGALRCSLQLRPRFNLNSVLHSMLRSVRRLRESGQEARGCGCGCRGLCVPCTYLPVSVGRGFAVAAC